MNILATLNRKLLSIHKHNNNFKSSASEECLYGWGLRKPIGKAFWRIALAALSGKYLFKTECTVISGSTIKRSTSKSRPREPRMVAKSYGICYATHTVEHNKKSLPKRRPRAMGTKPSTYSRLYFANKRQYWSLINVYSKM